MCIRDSPGGRGERGNLQPDIAGASGIGSKDKRDMDFRGVIREALRSISLFIYNFAAVFDLFLTFPDQLKDFFNGVSRTAF